MIKTIKVILLIMMISTSLFASNLLLIVQDNIPDIFVTGIKQELVPNYDNIFVKKMKDNECTEQCLGKLSEELKVKTAISISVSQKRESLLLFKALILDFKNSKIITKEDDFYISDEDGLYLFSKKFAKKIDTTEKSSQLNRKKDITFFNRNSEKRVSFTKKESIRKKYNVGVTLGFGGPNYLGVNLDYFITEYINIEISTIGYLPIVLGTKIFFSPKNRLSPYIGAHFSPLDLDGLLPVYIPLGLQYIAESGFTISGEFGLLSFNSVDFYDDYEEREYSKRRFYPWGGVKIGYHF